MAIERLYSNHTSALVLPKDVYKVIWDQLSSHRVGGDNAGFEYLWVNGCRIGYTENENEVGICEPATTTWRKLSFGNTGSL